MLTAILLLKIEKSYVIAFAILFIAIVLFLIYWFNEATSILRRLKKLPHNRIGSLRTNTYSKIEGKALNINEPFLAPLSKRKCVFYKIEIAKRVKRGKNSYWKTLVDEEHIQDFFIEQHGERVLVLPKKKPRNYRSYLVTDENAKSGTFNDPTPEFKRLLDSYNIDAQGLFGFNNQIRYTEAIVEVGERITVAGNIKWMELEEPITDYGYTTIASITNGTGKDKLIITDSPKAHRKRHQ